MPSMRAHRAPDDANREFAARLVRAGFVGLGALIVLLGVLIAPIPGPGGIP